VSERREMRSCLTFIAVRFLLVALVIGLVIALGAQISRANAI